MSILRGGQRFASFCAGMPLGELALLDRGARSADCVADMPSCVHALPVAALQLLQAQDPALGAALYQNLARHLAGRLRVASVAWHHAQG